MSDIDSLSCMWLATSKNSVQRAIESAKAIDNQIKILETKPHIILLQFIKGSKSFSNALDPSISEVIEYLYVRCKASGDINERMQLTSVHEWLKEAFTVYEQLVTKYAFARYFSMKEKMFPGSFKRFISTVTFSQALTSKMFTEGVQRTLDKRLSIIRGVQRSMLGFTTEGGRNTECVVGSIHKLPIFKVTDILNIQNTIENINVKFTTFQRKIVEIHNNSIFDSFRLFGLTITQDLKALTQLQNVMENSVCILSADGTHLTKSIHSKKQEIISLWHEFLLLNPSQSDFVEKVNDQKRYVLSLINSVIASEKTGTDIRQIWNDNNVKSTQDEIVHKISTKQSELTKAKWLGITTDILKMYESCEEDHLRKNKEFQKVIHLCKEVLASDSLKQPQKPVLSDNEMNEKWEILHKNAINLDVAYLILAFVEVIEKLPQSERESFVRNQKKTTSTNPTLLTATKFVYDARDEVIKKATHVLYETYHKPCLDLLHKLREILNVLQENYFKNACILKERYTASVLKKVEAEFNEITSISASLVNYDILKDDLTPIVELYNTYAFNASNVNQADNKAVIYHIQSGIQQIHILLKDAASLKDVTEVISIMLGIKTLFDYVILIA